MHKKWFNCASRQLPNWLTYISPRRSVAVTPWLCSETMNDAFSKKLEVNAAVSCQVIIGDHQDLLGRARFSRVLLLELCSEPKPLRAPSDEEPRSRQLLRTTLRFLQQRPSEEGWRADRCRWIKLPDAAVDQDDIKAQFAQGVGELSTAHTLK